MAAKEHDIIQKQTSRDSTQNSHCGGRSKTSNSPMPTRSNDIPNEKRSCINPKFPNPGLPIPLRMLGFHQIVVFSLVQKLDLLRVGVSSAKATSSLLIGHVAILETVLLKRMHSTFFICLSNRSICPTKGMNVHAKASNGPAPFPTVGSKDSGWQSLRSKEIVPESDQDVIVQILTKNHERRKESSKDNPPMPHWVESKILPKLLKWDSHTWDPATAQRRPSIICKSRSCQTCSF
mmetsp:Transcript_2662/g.5417  ORF Transcript_2662/g.5417 Transcript_2662/m.5417 type:complete len:235 (-) Transcript_2662:320-1024(-)